MNTTEMRQELSECIDDFERSEVVIAMDNEKDMIEGVKYLEEESNILDVLVEIVKCYSDEQIVELMDKYDDIEKKALILTFVSDEIKKEQLEKFEDPQDKKRIR